MNRTLFIIALVCTSAYANDVIGHIKLEKEELEFYGNTGSCTYSLDNQPAYGGYYASRWPKGRPDMFVMGCWKPIDANHFVIRFYDGVTMTLDRKQFIPITKESGVQL